MARTRSLAWSQLKIGILGVGALALATMLILAVGGQGGFSWERYALKTRFADVKGLKSGAVVRIRSEEHTSELQSRLHLVCRLLLEKKNATSGRGTPRPA